MKKHLVIAACAPFLFVGAAWGLDITQCGQRVPANETGVLQADLDCPRELQFCHSHPSVLCTTDAECPLISPSSARLQADFCTGAAVLLEKNAKLEVNGHTLKGGWAAAVHCAGNCTVRGPGQLEQPLTGPPPDLLPPVVVYGVKNITISDVTTEGGFAGVFCQKNVRATNVTVNHAVIYGVQANRTIRAANLTSSGGAGLYAIFAARVVGTDVTANNNAGYGVAASRVTVTRLTANGNGQRGLWALRARLTDSTLTGNVVVDISTNHPPHLENTVCDHSAQHPNTTPSWGVCALD